MTLKTARNIERAVGVVTFPLVLPVLAAAGILALLEKPVAWILDARMNLLWRAGNRLMHMSDAVKDGTVKNPYCLKHYTASLAWRHLKEAERTGREAEI